MRTVKKYDERRNEILDAAERLYLVKGYERCTINDILEEVAIAKGTLYYYFRSKEEILDALVLRYVEIAVGRAKEIQEKIELQPEEKLMRVFMAMQIKDKIDGSVMEELHKTENALLHQKTLSQLITTMIPVLEKVIEEGTVKKVWSCSYPVEYMQIFLAASLTLTDDGMFCLDGESQAKVMVALITMLEKMMNVKEGSFLQRYVQTMQQESKN